MEVRPAVQDVVVVSWRAGRRSVGVLAVFDHGDHGRSGSGKSHAGP